MYLIKVLILSALFLGCSEDRKSDSDSHSVQTEILNSQPDSDELKKISPDFSSHHVVSKGLQTALNSDESVILTTEKIKNGLIFDCYENGTKKGETNFKNGTKNGPFTRWYLNGNLKEQGIFLKDRLHGDYQKWNSDGQLMVKGYYFEGKQDGEWVLFDNNGNAMPSIYYKSGVEITRELNRFRR